MPQFYREFTSNERIIRLDDAVQLQEQTLEFAQVRGGLLAKDTPGAKKTKYNGDQ
jgi:hypothetical protein